MNKGKNHITKDGQAAANLNQPPVLFADIVQNKKSHLILPRGQEELYESPSKSRMILPGHKHRSISKLIKDILEEDKRSRHEKSQEKVPLPSLNLQVPNSSAPSNFPMPLGCIIKRDEDPLQSVIDEICRIADRIVTRRQRSYVIGLLKGKSRVVCLIKKYEQK